MLTKKDVLEQRERLQDDIICILDGIEQDIVDNCCQAIVDRLNILSYQALETY